MAPAVTEGSEAGRADAARALATAAALSVCGLAPLASTREPLPLLAWFALVAPAAGVLAGGARLALWPWAPIVPAVWMGAFALAGGAAERVVATPVWAACVWSGLYLAGHGLGALAGPRAPRWAGLVLLALGAWVALPIGLGWDDAPFPPPWTARLLALSPWTWIFDAAGVDWLHHAAFYERAHTFDLGPELVRPVRPALAGGALLLVGWLLAWAGASCARARARRVTAEGPGLPA